jgi:hypothetical protein
MTNGKSFNLDDYTRRTLAEKERLRDSENKTMLRKKQQEIFEKYGRKWMRPIGKAIYPSRQWTTLFGKPLIAIDFLYHIFSKAYTFLVVEWRMSLGEWLYLGGMKVKASQPRPGIVKLSAIVKGKVVEEVEVKV